MTSVGAATGAAAALVETETSCSAGILGCDTAKVANRAAGWSTASAASGVGAGDAADVDVLCAETVDSGGGAAVRAAVSLSEPPVGAIDAGAWTSGDPESGSASGTAGEGAESSVSAVSSAGCCDSSFGFESEPSASAESCSASDGVDADDSDADSDEEVEGDDAAPDDELESVEDELDSDESDDDELASSANAMAGHPPTNVPIPSATASAPTRPM